MQSTVEGIKINRTRSLYSQGLTVHPSTRHLFSNYLVYCVKAGCNDDTETQSLFTVQCGDRVVNRGELAYVTNTNTVQGR